MDRTKQIGSLFPTFDSIPPGVRLATPLRQDAYLVNGELRQWTGPMQDVFSPVCIETAAGAAPHLLGSYPLLSEHEAMAALRVFSIRTLVAAKAGELNKHILNTIVRERKSNFLSTDFIL